MTMRVLLLLLLVVLMSGCKKNVDIPLPDEANKLVLNLLMNKDSILMARVNVSERMNQFRPTGEIKNAAVNLYENGTFKETLVPYVYSKSTYYRSKTVPQAGAIYKVTAAAAGYADVWGTDVIPDTVAIDELKMTHVQVNNWLGKATISVQLHDDAAVENYYRVRIYVVNESRDANGNGLWQKSQRYFEAEEARLAIFSDKERLEFFTTDALFNGRSPRFSFRFDTYANSNKFMIEITSLTYNSYNYLHSAFMAREKNDDGLSEKVIVFNNIENGLGIIGGVAQREYVLKM